MYEVNDVVSPWILTFLVRFAISALVAPVPEWAFVRALIVRVVPLAFAVSDFASVSADVRVVEAIAIESPLTHPEVVTSVVKLVALAAASAFKNAFNVLLDPNVVNVPFPLSNIPLVTAVPFWLTFNKAVLVEGIGVPEVPNWTIPSPLI